MPQIPADYRVLAASHRHARAGARRTSSADPNEMLSVSVRIRRRADAPTLPDPASLAATPHREKRYITREDFAAHYGASQDDLDKIAAFAATNGLAVVETSIPRRTMVLKGTVAQMSKAFAVDLGMYETAAEKYRGREGPIHLPSGLVDIVEGVFGLDNRKMAEPHVRVSAKAPAEMSPHVSPDISPAQAIVPLTPPQVAQLYGFPTSPNASGQTIGIFEFGGGYKPSDVQLFYNSLHLAVPSITPVSILGQTNSPDNTNYTTETLLDIGVAGSVATGAKLAVYFAPWTEQGWVDIVTTAIHDTTNKPSVISISYGWPENETAGSLTWSQAAINAVDATFQEAAALGVTIFVSSGDSGSGCGMGDSKAHVEYPGSDPYVTCVGGTSISNVSGLSFKEDVWNDNGITGGGISDIFVAPNYPPIWQNWANLPGSANDGHKGRGVPDIAGNADELSGYTLFQNGVNIGPVGGTSAAAPLYAGLAALMNAGLGEPVGYLNPNLYAMPYSYVFRDINDGQSNASGGAPGYTSGPGWDACTGLGGVNGAALEYALQGVGLPVALADFNGKLYMVWKGMERDDRVFYSSFNGTSWAPQTQISGIGSSSGVALAVYAGKLYMAWKGVLGDQGIYYSSFNGTTWAPQQLVSGIGSSVGPSLAVLGNNLFMAWKGVEGDQRIFFNQFNGSSWTAQQLVPNVGTSVGPACVVFNNALYMVWKGEDGDQGLYWSKFNGTAFAPQASVGNVGSSGGLALAVMNGKVYAAWKGEFGDQRLWYTTFNGSTWAAQTQVPGVASSVGPGLALFNNALFACWKGELGDQSIWYSSFNGTAWAAQKQVPGVGTSPDLVMAAE